MRFLVLVLCALTLTACVTPQQMRARQALSDGMDGQDYGFEPGTDLYATCRMNMAQNRETRQSVEQAASMQQLNMLQMQLQRQEAQRRAAFEASRPKTTQCNRIGYDQLNCTTW
jgi:hypothetical protein